MIGAAVFYKVPSSQGWRVLRGAIVNITPTAIVVQEKYLGGQSTIRHHWLVSYDWSDKQTAAIA